MWLANSGIEVCGQSGTYLTDKLCSPMNRNKPASTLVGVKPRTRISGGLTKLRPAVLLVDLVLKAQGAR